MKYIVITSKLHDGFVMYHSLAEGVIPQASQDNLRAVGRWLKINGEAIYGAGPTPFGSELGAPDATKLTKDGKPVFVAGCLAQEVEAEPERRSRDGKFAGQGARTDCFRAGA